MTAAQSIPMSRIESALRTRERLTRTTSIAMVLAGVPLLFVGPFVMSIIFWFATWSAIGHYPWWWFFAGLCLLMIPLLVHLELRTRGSFLGDAVISSGGASPAPYVLGSDLGMLISFVAYPRTSASGFVELFLVGPRLLIGGWEKLRKMSKLGPVKVSRAAQIVEYLARTDRGVAPEHLLHERETLRSIAAPLSYLLLHEWIDISKIGDRVWLLTSARESLRG